MTNDTNTTEFGKKDFPQDYSFITDAAKSAQATYEAESLLELLDSMNDKELCEVQNSAEGKALLNSLLKRKADEEKRKQVSVISSLIKTAGACGLDEIGIAEYLHEQGCRFTENKAAS